HEELLLAGAGRLHVHRGEDPLVRERPAELELHVAGALELLEDDLVHLRAGLHQRGGDDGERSAVLDVPRGAEEPLRRVERGRVHTTRQDPPARRRGEVVRAAETGDRVEQDDHVVAELDQALGPLDRELGDRGVVLGGAVEGRVDDLALHRPLHVGDLFRTLVHEDDHQVALRVVAGDRVRDRLEHHGLPRLGRRDDEAALPLADRRDEVDDPRGEDVRLGLQPQPLLRVERRELAELGPVARLLRVHAVDRVEPDERVELLPALALARLPDRPGDDVTLAQAVLADLGHRDVHVVRTGQVAAGPHERVVVEDVQDPGDRDEDVVLADHGLAVLVPVPPAAVALAEPAAAAAALLGRLLLLLLLGLGLRLAGLGLAVLRLAAVGLAALLLATTLTGVGGALLGPLAPLPAGPALAALTPLGPALGAVGLHRLALCGIARPGLTRRGLTLRSGRGGDRGGRLRGLPLSGGLLRRLLLGGGLPELRLLLLNGRDELALAHPSD